MYITPRFSTIIVFWSALQYVFCEIKNKALKKTRVHFPMKLQEVTQTFSKKIFDISVRTRDQTKGLCICHLFKLAVFSF